MNRFALCLLGLGLCAAIPLLAGESGDFSVRAFGATGDGRTLDTAAVNRAIAAAAAAGGGTVEFPAGDYLCHSIHLQSRIALHLQPGATIIAADPPADGADGPGYDVPEPSAWTQFQDFGHSHFHNSLIWGENLENVSITGPGRIYGRGLSRGNSRIALPVGVLPDFPPDRPPDALEADGPFPITPRPDLVPGPFGYPNARDRKADGVGNKAIALKNCRNVILRDFSILHGGHFGLLAIGTDNLTIDNLTIDTNRDGMDIDACNNVRISNCTVNTPWDDGICLKSSYALGEARLLENVTITNCAVSGYDEGTVLDGTRQRKTRHRGGAMGRIKLGTEASGGFRNIAITNCVFDYCRGLALEQVDGGILEDVTISNIAMRDITNAPIFLRLGARLRAPGATTPGHVRRILIQNIVASAVSPDHGILIAGLPGHPIEDIVLVNLQIHYLGGGTLEQAARVVPEFEKSYPDPYNFGIIPSWGMFIRHATNVQVRGVELRALSADQRPAIILDDVAGARFSDLRVTNIPARPIWQTKDVTGLELRDSPPLNP